MTFPLIAEWIAITMFIGEGPVIVTISVKLCSSRQFRPLAPRGNIRLVSLFARRL